jgi:hypothetical protein
MTLDTREHLVAAPPRLPPQSLSPISPAITGTFAITGVT